MIEGVFYDGERSTARPARVEIEAPDVVRLRLVPEPEPPRWTGRLREVELSERIGHIPRRIRIPGVGEFETRDNAAIDRALAALGERRGLVHRLESRWSVALAALVAILVGTVLFVRFGLPALADEVAHALPPTLDRLIGARTLELLDDRLLHPSELPPERRTELQARFDALRVEAGPAAEGGIPERLELRAAPELGPNALALPSGIVVLTDELVGIAEHDDELVAVLAHELGHVRGRHALRQLLRSVGVSALAFALIGDVGSTSALFGAIPALIEAKHSRDFEREADAFARARLAELGIAPDRFDAILCRMEHGDPGIGRYLSTHPPTDERARCEPIGEERSQRELDEPTQEPQPDPPPARSRSTTSS